MKSATLILIALLLAACTTTTPGTTPGTTSGTTPSTVKENTDISALVDAKHFATADELSTFLRKNTGSSYADSFGGGVMMRTANSGIAEKVAAPTAAGANNLDVGLDFSQTNVQVAGVDEADILKTDGEYIYTTSGNTLFIVKAYPGQDAKVVSSLDLKQTPSGLFIDGNTLVVIASFYDKDYFKAHNLRPRYDLTVAWLYDVSDKANPRRVKEFVLEGTYFQSRMKDGVAYVIVQSSPNYREPMPLIMEDGVSRTVPLNDIYYFPIPYDDVSYTTIHSIDIQNKEITDSATIATESSRQLYMSQDNIYLAATRNINEWKLMEDVLHELVDPKLDSYERSMITKIENADDDVLSRWEKQSKISQIYSEHMQLMDETESAALQKQAEELVAKKLEEFPYPQYTALTRIAYNNGKLSVEANGIVPGQVNNQFSMDEKDNVLRVATTVTPQWGWIRPMMALDTATPLTAEAGSAGSAAKIAPQPRSETFNNVYTLDKDLKVLDKIENIAPGESIFSARFIGERLYLVTFRQVDPFFVFDLSNPSNIKSLGQLKVPGFSRYLHPYDENTIIGIGRDATATGSQQGIKISLFDVTNPEKPIEKAKWVADEQYSQTAAEWEHKAFLFDKEKELLVIPAYSYNWDMNRQGERYNGALVFKITPNEITLRGLIDHSSAAPDYYWQPAVERSLFIEDLLYTKSTSLIRVNELSDLSSVKNVTLTAKAAVPYPVY